MRPAAKMQVPRPTWWNGRRTRLKICWGVIPVRVRVPLSAPLVSRLPEANATSLDLEIPIHLDTPWTLLGLNASQNRRPDVCSSQVSEEKGLEKLPLS